MNKRLPQLILLFPILLLLSCSSTRHTGSKGNQIVVYPPPPDTTRLQFLTTISNSQHITGRRGAFSRFVLGEVPPQPVVKPYGLAAMNGKVYVCDASIAGLEIMDLRTKEFNYFIPKGLGLLKMPANCAVDSSGTLYVADAMRRQIVVFDAAGNFKDAFGDANDAKPTDIAISDGKLFVPDASHNRVNVYDQSTRKLDFYFPDSLETGEGHLYQPVNIAVRGDNVYVTDFGDFRVKTYTKDGGFVSVLGSFGNSPGQFVRPKGIDVDRDRILYAVDAGFENVQMFNRDGQLLMFFGGPYKGPGDMWLPAKVVVDYENVKSFEQFVDPAFRLKYLVWVTNQYGPDKINIYGAVELKK
jgi:DNA-binding beta-propeller fold protein YncE